MIETWDDLEKALGSQGIKIGRRISIQCAGKLKDPTVPHSKCHMPDVCDCKCHKK